MKTKKHIRGKLNEEAIKRYGEPFDELCSKRKQTVIKLVGTLK